MVPKFKLDLDLTTVITWNVSSEIKGKNSLISLVSFTFKIVHNQIHLKIYSSQVIAKENYWKTRSVTILAKEYDL